VRVFLAGATGVLGLRIVPLLVESGHVVAGLTRSPEKASLLTARGAVAVIGDVFDREAISQAVADFRPDLVMSQLTDLPDEVDRIRDFRDANIRIRREGVANLLGASGGAGVEQVLVQSVAWELPGEAGRAVEDMERAVLEAGGTVLRYGQFYGPGTYHPESPPEHPRIHLDDAARRTVEVLEFGPGIVELVEDPG
jgi:uncharacterized protein YbjT (DUF2867 family)